MTSMALTRHTHSEPVRESGPGLSKIFNFDSVPWERVVVVQGRGGGGD